MPELPEVEVTRRQIEPVLVGRRIARVVTTANSYFFLTPPKQLKRRLRGRQVSKLERHGKYLVAQLDDDSRLLLHLGMTGQLFVDGASSVRLLTSTRSGALTPEQQAKGFTPDAHTHLALEFEDGGRGLFFRDVRKFGKVQLLAPGAACKRLDRLGVDALKITGARLHRACGGRKLAMKSLLLDQSVLAGVGNIYADEALFLAGVMPSRPAAELSRNECDALAKTIKKVLRRSIATGGSSISDYIQPNGRDGSYQDERKVYARTDLPCLVCGEKIKRIVLGQRTTHFCPRCQSAAC